MKDPDAISAQLWKSEMSEWDAVSRALVSRRCGPLTRPDMADLANQRDVAVLYRYCFLAPFGQGQGLVQGIC